MDSILDLINSVAGNSGESFMLKLLRAIEHFETLETKIAVFLERKPYVAIREAETERTQYRVKVNEQCPAEFALIVGDVAQNARASLEHLAWRLAGDQANRSTTFPIYAKREEFFAQDRGGKPARQSGVFKIAAFPEKAQAVVEAMQPYHGHIPGLTLGVLNDLARADRHQLLHLVGGASDDVRISGGRRNQRGELVMGNAGARGVMTARLGPFEDGAVITSFTHAPDVEMECDFTFYVAMSSGEDPGGFQPVLPCLAGTLAAVRDALLALGPLCPPRSKPTWASGPVLKIDAGDALVMKSAAPGRPYTARIRHDDLPPTKR